MSSTDPDLEPREANNIIAADVVDGKLILRRYDGSEEVVSVGGGIIETTILNLNLVSDGTIPPNSNTVLKINYGSLTPSNDPDTSLQEFDDTASVPEGYAVGDEYILKRTVNGEVSADTVLFKKKGLYHFVMYSGTETFAVGTMFQINYDGKRGSVMVLTPQTIVPPVGTMPFIVGEVDLAPLDVISGGAELSILAQNGGDSDLSFSANIAISRII